MTLTTPTLTPTPSNPIRRRSSCSVIRLYRLQACRTKRPNGGSALMWGEGRAGRGDAGPRFKYPLSFLLLLLCPRSLLLGSTLSLLAPFCWWAGAMKNQQRSRQSPPPSPPPAPFTRPTAGCSGCPCARVFSGGLKAERSTWIKCVGVGGSEGTEGALSGGVPRTRLVL